MSEQEKPKDVEKARIPLPVSIDVQLTPDAIVEMLQQSKIYNRKFKPRMDVGKFLEDQVSKDFYQVFYDKLARGELDFEGFLELLKAYHSEKLITGR